MKASVKRVLVLPDTHIPFEDSKAINAVLKYAKVSKPWDEVIHLGDLLDMNSISSHNKGNLRAVEGQTLDNDFKCGERFLDSLALAVGPTKTVLLEGNHEYRVERYVDANPQLAGVVEVERRLHLKQRGIKWVRSWSQGEVYRIGKAAFVHGAYVNDHHAKSAVIAYEENVFYGHTHDVQGYTKRSKGDHNTKIGQSLGCLCAYDQKYMLGRPSRWQQAFGVFHFRPDGFFNFYVPFIFKGSFVGPDGKVYEG